MILGSHAWCEVSVKTANEIWNEKYKGREMYNNEMLEGEKRNSQKIQKLADSRRESKKHEDKGND